MADKVPAIAPVGALEKPVLLDMAPWTWDALPAHLWNLPGGWGSLLGALLGLLAVAWAAKVGFNNLIAAQKHQAELEIVAKELLDKEIVFQADLERLIGKRPFEQPTTYQAFADQEDPEKVEDPDRGMGVDELKKNIFSKIKEEESNPSKKSTTESDDIK